MINAVDQFIAVEHINASPGRFTMSFACDLDPLKRSLQEIGLANPPYVLALGPSGPWEVVSGFRRVAALRALGWQGIPCRVVRQERISDLDLFRFSLFDNLATRTFNPVEAAMALKTLSGLAHRGEILEFYMPAMGLPPHPGSLAFYLRIADELDQPQKEALARGTLPLATARRLLELPADARQQVFEAIANLRLNLNQSKQLIELVEDMAHIEGVSMNAVLDQAPFVALLAEPDGNIPQRAKEFLQRLRQRRFPTLTGAEERFRQAVASLKLPAGVRIEAPPAFEAPGFKLEIAFRDGRRLLEQINRIATLKELEDFGSDLLQVDE